MLVCWISVLIYLSMLQLSRAGLIPRVVNEDDKWFVMNGEHRQGLKLHVFVDPRDVNGEVFIVPF